MPAQAFIRKAVTTQQSAEPRKVTLDGHAASHGAIRLLCDEDPRWKPVTVRSCRYLNYEGEGAGVLKQLCLSAQSRSMERQADLAVPMVPAFSAPAQVWLKVV